jgi:hypothetical protein
MHNSPSSPDHYLSEPDRELLSDTGAQIVMHLLERFEGKFPDAIILPETGSRPFASLLHAAIGPIAAKRGIAMPRFYFFARDRMDVIERKFDPRPIETPEWKDEELTKAEESVKDIERSIAQETEAIAAAAHIPVREIEERIERNLHFDYYWMARKVVPEEPMQGGVHSDAFNALRKELEERTARLLRLREDFFRGEEELKDQIRRFRAREIRSHLASQGIEHPKFCVIDDVVCSEMTLANVSYAFGEDLPSAAFLYKTDEEERPGGVFIPELRGKSFGIALNLPKAGFGFQDYDNPPKKAVGVEKGNKISAYVQKYPLADPKLMRALRRDMLEIGGKIADTILNLQGKQE